MNIAVQARIYQDDGPRIVQFELEMPDPATLEETLLEITPEQLDRLLEWSLAHDSAPAVAPKIDMNTLDTIAPRERYQKSMVRGPDDCTCCSICITQFKPRMYVRRLPCGHLFCCKCISKWVSRHNAVCPTCRCSLATCEYEHTG